MLIFIQAGSNVVNYADALTHLFAVIHIISFDNAASTWCISIQQGDLVASFKSCRCAFGTDLYLAARNIGTISRRHRQQNIASPGTAGQTEVIGIKILHLTDSPLLAVKIQSIAADRAICTKATIKYCPVFIKNRRTADSHCIACNSTAFTIAAVNILLDRAAADIYAVVCSCTNTTTAAVDVTHLTAADINFVVCN